MKFLKILSSLKVILVFVLLEILALLMFSNRSVFQRSRFVRFSMETSSFLYSKSNEITSYFSLKSTNEELARHNAELQKQIELLQNTVQRQNYLTSLEYDSTIAFIPAKIVTKTVNNIDNYFIVNKGAKDGVKEGFGVVSNGKVVGVIQYVSDHYSAALLIISSKIKLSGKIKNDGYLCTVVRDNLSTSKANIEDIPYHIDIKIGDTIVTSGFSTIFPENYIIGTIAKITSNPSTASNDLKIDYVTDFIRVNYVEIIAPKDIEEINQINTQIIEQ
ncbi:MAG: rod shape-determining protein MreC [Porphyromonadaceae bacterium]|nr:rod shape-determining protein MreC [Porphyromonadaceae bacterium]